MRRLWLGLACGALLAAAPSAFAQDTNATLAAYNCGTPAEAPTPPNGQRATPQQMQSFTERAQQWQAAQVAILQCVTSAQNAMDTRTQARIDEFNQRSNQAAQAATAWRAAAGTTGHQ
ncbi:MAG: hypothetical protein QM759_10820 [Terricaulis sp.]